MKACRVLKKKYMWFDIKLPTFNSLTRKIIIFHINADFSAESARFFTKATELPSKEALL